MKILITGIAGTVGTIVAERLSADHEISGIDIRNTDQFATRVLDLNDYDAIRPRFDGIDVVIHLAAEPGHGREIGWDVLMPRNVQPTANVFQAAHEAGVHRIVFASSMHVMGMYEEDEPWRSIAAGDYGDLDPATVPLVTADMPVRADGRYAVTKAFGEQLARYYAEGMEAVSVRLGTISGDNHPDADARSYVSWFSHRDLGNFFAACVEKPGIKNAIVYGASANTWKIYDTSAGWATLGFTPQDGAEAFRPQ
jgi:nucleoside-diphosphate-sugar epimerase